MWQQGKNKSGIDKYYIENCKSTICKIQLGDKTVYELWFQDKQYHGFATADEAKQKYNLLMKETICTK